MDRITLREAVKFHGHLGPYLVLGLLAGRLALKELNCKKYSGLEVRVGGADKKPKSCFIDGIQLSTGATYGKGNIRKIKGRNVKAICRNLKNKKKVEVSFNNALIKQLERLKGHRDSRYLARVLYKTDPFTIFKLITKN